MRKVKVFLIFIISLILTSCQNKEPFLVREYMMDTLITFQIYDGSKKDIDSACKEAIEKITDIENRMSLYKHSSQLSEINKNAGLKPIKVDEDLFELIKISKEVSHMSSGAYDVSIGPLVDLWDIKAGERKSDELPKSLQIKETLELVNYKDIDLLSGNRVYLKEKGMKLDLGAIVKGFAADQVKDIFKKNKINSAIIDLGGNIYVLGGKNGEDWNIGIQDPLDRENYLGIIDLKDSTIVTSGNYERFFDLDGYRYHHILNPRTGKPSNSGLLSVSIIADNSMLADILSTTVFVLGEEKGEKFLQENFPEVEYIIVTEDRKVKYKLIDKTKFILTNEKYRLIKN